MYQQSPKTITVTATGQPVDIRPDFTTKTVSVYVQGEYCGTWNCHSAAKAALQLVDVPARKVK